MTAVAASPSQSRLEDEKEKEYGHIVMTAPTATTDKSTGTRQVPDDEGTSLTFIRGRCELPRVYAPRSCRVSREISDGVIRHKRTSQLVHPPIETNTQTSYIYIYTNISVGAIVSLLVSMLVTLAIDLVLVWYFKCVSSEN